MSHLPDEPWDRLLARAEALLALPSSDRLASLAEELIALDPEALEGYVFRAEAAMRRDDHAAAIRAWKQACEIAPENVHALCGLASAYRLAEEAEDAEEVIDRALRLEPTDAGAWLEKAEILYADMDPRAAEAALERYFELRPGGLDGLHLQARIAEEKVLRPTDEHIEQYRELLATDPDDAAVHHDLACLHLDRGELEQAHEHALAALRGDPTDPLLQDTLFAVRARRSRGYGLLTAPRRALDDLGYLYTLIPTGVLAILFLSGLGAVMMAVLLAGYVLHYLLLRPFVRAYEDWNIAGLRAAADDTDDRTSATRPPILLRLRAILRVVAAPLVWYGLYTMARTETGWTVLHWAGMLAAGGLVLASVFLGLGAWLTWRDERRRAKSLVRPED